jgi:hypothetical protein
MKNFYLLIVISSIFLLSTSCSDDEEVMKTSEYLVFGHFYGFCMGESCVQIYKLENGKLYRDSKKEYPRYDEFYEGSYVAMDKSDYDQVKDLTEIFPVQLLVAQDTVFGCPDCADQGGLYIEYKSDDMHRFWMVDQFNGNVPVYLHEFMEEVNEKIDLLND